MKIEISYAYPSSPHAELFNYTDIGCYCVAFVDTLFNPSNEPVRAFETLEKAKQFAMAESYSGFEFSKYSL